MKANFNLETGAKTFASGLLPELIAALRRSPAFRAVRARAGRQVASVGSNLCASGPSTAFRPAPLVTRRIGYGQRGTVPGGAPVSPGSWKCRLRAFLRISSSMPISAATSRSQAAIIAYAVPGRTLPSRHNMNGMK